MRVSRMRLSGVEPRSETVLVKADSFLKQVVGAVKRLVKQVGHQFERLVVQGRRRRFTVWKSTMRALD